ncbi:hypothetical protein B0H12DRAFT_64820 [Mycena haematopus]|nr:hypothetical protein B0H12DRAFT_64820 [Mycena haematopus]
MPSPGKAAPLQQLRLFPLRCCTSLPRTYTLRSTPSSPPQYPSATDRYPQNTRDVPILRSWFAITRLYASITNGVMYIQYIAPFDSACSAGTGYTLNASIRYQRAIAVRNTSCCSFRSAFCLTFDKNPYHSTPHPAHMLRCVALL